MTLEELDIIKKRKEDLESKINYNKSISKNLKNIFSNNECITINGIYYDANLSDYIKQCITFNQEKFNTNITILENKLSEIDKKLFEIEEALKGIQ